MVGEFSYMILQKSFLPCIFSLIDTKKTIQAHLYDKSIFKTLSRLTVKVSSSGHCGREGSVAVLETMKRLLSECKVHLTSESIFALS